MYAYNGTLFRAARVGGASLALALLAACHGHSNSGQPSANPTVTYKVVSFGDSLSDVGSITPIGDSR